MATDLMTSAANAAVEASTDMPHRLLSLIPHPRTFALGVLSSAGSLLASVSSEHAVSFALALVAIGTVLAQPLLKAYKAIRDAKLEADAREYSVWDAKLSGKSEQLGEALGRLRVAEERVEQLESRLAEYEVKVDSYPTRTAKTIKREVAKAVESDLKPKLEAVESRVDAVEAAQGSTSDLNLPATKE